MNGPSRNRAISTLQSHLERLGDHRTAAKLAMAWNSSTKRANLQRLRQGHIDQAIRRAGGNAGLALVAAAAQGKKVLATFLLDSGADVDARRGPLGTTALIAACTNGRTDVVELLVERGANVDLRDIHGSTALWHAVDNNATASVRILLRHPSIGIDIPGSVGHARMTPLMIAIQNHRADIARMILRRSPASVNASYRNGITALFLPLRIREDAEAIRFLDMLLTLGRPTQATKDAVFTSVSMSTRSIKNPKFSELLLRHGANVNAKDAVFGGTPLMTAARLRSPERVAFLLKHGANVNAKDLRGRTALMHAIETRENPSLPKLPVVKMLVEHGASVSNRNAAGRSALDLARDDRGILRALVAGSNGNQMHLRRRTRIA